MKYKIGDKVRIVSKTTEEMNWTDEMDVYLGRVMTIKHTGRSIFNEHYKMAEDNGDYYWDDSLIVGLASETSFDFNAWKGKDVCMHCKTEEESEDFRKVMNKAGLRWSSGSSYLLWSCFEPYGEQTCYCFNKGTYESTVRAKDKGYTILEWSEYRSTEPPKDEEQEEQEKTMETKIDDKPLSYQKAVKIRKMICREHGNCNDCPLDEKNNGLNEFCSDAFGQHPNETEKILKKWVAEHIVTNEDKCNEMFLEVFGMQYATALMDTNWWKQKYVDPFEEKE